MKNTIGVNYRRLGTHGIHVTAPWTCWHKGTAFHVDTMKNNPCLLLEHAELGIDLVLLAMAARLTHSLFSLAKNLIQKRIWCWKMLPGACVTKAFHAVLWMFWNVMDILIALEMTDMICNKKYSTPKLAGHTGIMSSATMKHLAAEPPSPEGEEAPNAVSMEHLQDTMSMDKMWSKGLLLPSCTNPLILSMICQPSDDDASSTSGESDGSDWETEDNSPLGEEELPSQGMSTDCSLQVFWTTRSKDDDDEHSDESDWSDSWDTDSNPDSSKVDEDLWESFCQNDDPYNPFCFSMPMKSPKKHLDVPETEKLSYVDLEVQEPGRIKKVRFSPDVTVITLPDDETERKGPWEEYARDRCRFQKRIKESGDAISYCLEPEFRRDSWIRLYGRDGL